MATKAALSGDSGTSAFLSLLGILVLSVVEVEGDYSDAVFDCSSSRSVLRGGTLHGRMLLVGLRHKCRHCPASTFGGILVPLRSYFFFFFWTYSRSVYSNLHLRTDAVHSRSLAHLFSSTRFTTAFGRVIIHFSVAKLVCSRARLKSLGQWRSFTNLPLSSLWFWRLALTKIKRI